MTDPTIFLTTMSALSTAVQTFVDHVVKGHWAWLNTATPDRPRNEEWRQSTVHLISFAIGALLAHKFGVNPLDALSLSDPTPVANSLAAGVLVSFGSSFFNEALDAVRAFKKAQEGLRQGQIKEGVKLLNVTS